MDLKDFEREQKRLQPVIRRLRDLSLFGKKLEVSGKENFIDSGPNIIVGNHVGSFKDIAVLFKISSRFLFFTANRMIFSRKDFNTLIRDYLKFSLNELGLFIDLLLKPWKAPLVDYISRNIPKIGTIPVDLSGGKVSAIGHCQDRLRSGGAVVLLQGRGKIESGSANPYIPAFRRGPAVICFNLMQEGQEVPVTPLAIYRSHWPVFVPCSIHVKIGAPITIKKFMSADAGHTISLFRKALEDRVRQLFYELITSQSGIAPEFPS